MLRVIPPMLRLIAVGATVAGLSLRALMLAAFPFMPLHTCDGRAYLSMAQSWAAGNGFYVADPGIGAACDIAITIGPSHHFGPALPFVEGLFIRLFGNGEVGFVVALIAISWAAVFVAWWTTRNLFGSDAGLLVAASVSLEWTGVLFGTWFGYAENLVLITFTLAIWAMFRAARDNRYAVPAGLSAGIGYLAKATVGWFFLVAAFGRLIWHLRSRGLSALRNRWYWAAIAVFAAPVVAWSLRNILLFWDGSLASLIGAAQTSDYASGLVAAAFRRPDLFLVGLVGKLPITAAVLALPFLPLLTRSVSLEDLHKDRQAMHLWLAAGLIFLLGWVFASAFWVTEQTNLLWADVGRYVMPAQVPLLWLLVRGREPASTKRWAASFAILGVLLVTMPILVHQGNVFGR